MRHKCAKEKSRVSFMKECRNGETGLKCAFPCIRVKVNALVWVKVCIFLRVSCVFQRLFLTSIQAYIFKWCRIQTRLFKCSYCHKVQKNMKISKYLCKTGEINKNPFAFSTASALPYPCHASVGLWFFHRTWIQFWTTPSPSSLDLMSFCLSAVFTITIIFCLLFLFLKERRGRAAAVNPPFNIAFLLLLFCFNKLALIRRSRREHW